MHCYIKEKSWLARIAARKLGEKKVAIVFRRTIHLHNTSREEFLSDREWVCHELQHVRQYYENGSPGFVIKYLWESLLHGYQNNRFEKEARDNETNLALLNSIEIR
jgi:hypothetical protein